MRTEKTIQSQDYSGEANLSLVECRTCGARVLTILNLSRSERFRPIPLVYGRQGECLLKEWINEWSCGSRAQLYMTMHRCWSQSTLLSITIYDFKDCWGRRYQAHSVKILYAQWFKSTGNRMEQDCILEKVWSGIPCPPQCRLTRLCDI